MPVPGLFLSEYFQSSTSCLLALQTVLNMASSSYRDFQKLLKKELLGYLPLVFDETQRKLPELQALDRTHYKDTVFGEYLVCCDLRDEMIDSQLCDLAFCGCLIKGAPIF